MDLSSKESPRFDLNSAGITFGIYFFLENAPRIPVEIQELEGLISIEFFEKITETEDEPSPITLGECKFDQNSEYGQEI